MLVMSSKKHQGTMQEEGLTNRNHLLLQTHDKRSIAESLHAHINRVAFFPGPAQLSVACSTESGRGPGIIYHVSDVEGREKGREDLIERRRIVNVSTHVIACRSIIDSTCSRVLVEAHSGRVFF